MTTNVSFLAVVVSLLISGTAFAQSKRELTIHGGLTQPIVLRGINLAVDLRYDQWLASYSHGYGLTYSNAPGALTSEEEDANLRVYAPYSTGGGVGRVLYKGLYVLADFKVHHFEVSAGAQESSYSTITVGGEVGWRFYIWKQLSITPVIRYWPTVWDNQSADDKLIRTADGGSVAHSPMAQGYNGLFANVLLGWTFDLGSRP